MVIKKMGRERETDFPGAETEVGGGGEVEVEEAGAVVEEEFMRVGGGGRNEDALDPDALEEDAAQSHPLLRRRLPSLLQLRAHHFHRCQFVIHLSLSVSVSLSLSPNQKQKRNGGNRSAVPSNGRETGSGKSFEGIWVGLVSDKPQF